MTTSLKPSEKGVKWAIYDPIPSMWLKFGENWSSRFGVIFAQMFIIKNKEKKENDANRTISRGNTAHRACMLRGLNNWSALGGVKTGKSRPIVVLNSFLFTKL